MKVQYYKTNHGIFFSIDAGGWYSISGMLVNGIEGSVIPKYGSFYRIEGDSLVFQRKVPERKIQTGWQLKNKALASAILPLNLPTIAIMKDFDEDENDWIGEYAEYSSLYEAVYDVVPADLESMEVTLVNLGELQISNLSKPEETKVKLVHGSCGGQSQTVNLSSIVTYDALTKIVVPDFMLHNHPCSLSSKQVYEIIRSYVKENLNPKTAKVTSDYDFCFSVSKVYATVKPIKASQEVKKTNGRSYASPKFKNIEVNKSSYQIFEMTWVGYRGKPEGYSGYTPIEPWKADNLADMKEQVNKYLESLMSVLNAESKECNCCKGTGFIFDKQETKETIK